MKTNYVKAARRRAEVQCVQRGEANDRVDRKTEHYKIVLRTNYEL